MNADDLINIMKKLEPLYVTEDRSVFNGRGLTLMIDKYVEPRLCCGVTHPDPRWVGTGYKANFYFLTVKESTVDIRDYKEVGKLYLHIDGLYSESNNRAMQSKERMVSPMIPILLEELSKG